MNWLKQIKRAKTAEIPTHFQERIEKAKKKLIYQKNGYMAGAEPFFIYPSTDVGVLLLHGFTSTPAQFLELGEYLAGKGITVYAPLIAGHGTKPDDLGKTTAKDWVDSCQVAYEELKSKVKNVFIVGNSFGGNIAFQLTLDNPDEIRGVISMGTPVWVRAHRFLKYRSFTYGYLRKYWRKPRTFYKSGLSHLLDEITYPKIPLPACRQFFSFIHKTFKNMPKIKVPTLVIQAEIDPIVNPKSALRIHECLGSKDKKICWVGGSTSHSMVDEQKRGEIYKKIYNFVQEIYNRDHE